MPIDEGIKFVAQIHDLVYVAIVQDQEIDPERQGKGQEVHDEIIIGKGEFVTNRIRQVNFMHFMCKGLAFPF